MIAAELIWNILVCFGVPIAGVMLVRKWKKNIYRPFFIGMLTFTVTQVCIRIPILTFVLPKFTWYHVMSIDVWSSGIFLGATAALFEEVGRYISIRYLLKNNRTFQDGLAFGLGHGGIEAILFAGINSVAALAMTLTGNGIFLQAQAGSVWISGMERIFAMAFHVGASLLILYGFRSKKPILFLFAALFAHTILDALVVILPGAFGVGIMGVELVGAVFGVGTLAVSVILFMTSVPDCRCILFQKRRTL